MRRFLHGLLVGVLTLWIPIDSAVAGWWHHHHRPASPLAWGPAFAPPCGAGVPFPGWAGAIVIDDRPLGAPAPFAVVTAPPAEVVLDGWITTGPVEGCIVDEGIILNEGMLVADGSIVGGDCLCDPCQNATIADSGTVSEGTVIETDTPSVLDGVIGMPTPVVEGHGGDARIVTTQQPVEAPVPITPDEQGLEPESQTLLELPGTAAATTSSDPAAATQPAPAEAPAASVLEPWEPKTVQGDATAETATDEPVAETMEEAEAFERPGMPADDDAADEAMEDEEMEEESPEDEADEAPSQPKRRNVFDEAPSDSPEAFEAPRTIGDDALPPGDAFDAPDDGFEAPEEAMEEPGSDDDFGIPEEPPMDDAPADEMEGDGFEPATDEPMDEAPADEGAADAEPGADEVPVEKDPFDSNVLHTPGQPSRAWRDDSGHHGTVGRLVEVHADRVRILKASGRHTTVPMSRLSRADRGHVAGVALALGRSAARAGETAGL
ncbi:MAG: hypothetical protein NT171_05445 [Planctomycetota bacterium]|nr:hypothetical protein [Planctomycetota bacterium]